MKEQYVIGINLFVDFKNWMWHEIEEKLFSKNGRISDLYLVSLFCAEGSSQRWNFNRFVNSNTHNSRREAPSQLEWSPFASVEISIVL